MGNQTSLKTSPTQRSPLDPPTLWFVYLGFGRGKRRNCGFIDGCFCKNFRAGFHSRVTGKTKAFLYEPQLLAFRSCISGDFELLHFFVSFNGGHDYFKFLTVTR